MQNLPPKHSHPSSPHRSPMQKNSQRPTLPVQQSKLPPHHTQTITQNLRVPAVNTLKSGGPRLAVPRNMQPELAEKKRRQRMAAEYAKAKKRTMLRDFFFGFFVGLIAFGIAAIFVCQALINMFAIA